MAGRGCRTRHPAEMEPRVGSAAPGSFAPKRSARRPGARQRLLRAARIGGGEVSLWPILLPPSFDHLVGAGEQRRRHFKAKCLRSFEIDDKLEFGRRLYRKIARLLTLEDAIDIIGRAP